MIDYVNRSTGDAWKRAGRHADAFCVGMLFPVAAYNAEVTPSPTSPAYLPAGYCRCGYRTDPGVCSECGRVNRRMRRWDPADAKARWVRWFLGTLFLAAGVIGLFIGGKYILWNYWPLSQIQDLSVSPGEGAWDKWWRALGEQIVDHRSRQMSELAQARFRVLRELPLRIVAPLDADARYVDVFGRTVFIHNGECCIAYEPGKSPTAEIIAMYGTVVKQTEANLLVRVDWDSSNPRIRPVENRSLEVYVRATLDRTPVLVNLPSLRDAWRGARLRRGNLNGVFCPERMAGLLSDRGQAMELYIPEEYCAEVLPTELIACVTNVTIEPFPGHPQTIKETVELNVGTAHGVRRGLKFVLHNNKSSNHWIRINRVGRFTCSADKTMSDATLGQHPHSPRPTVGMLMRSVPE